MVNKDAGHIRVLPLLSLQESRRVDLSLVPTVRTQWFVEVNVQKGGAPKECRPSELIKFISESTLVLQSVS